MQYKSCEANGHGLTESDLLRCTPGVTFLYLNSKIASDLYRMQISVTIKIETSIKSKY